MAKIIEVPADIHEDVDALFQTVDREADALVQELLQDRLRALRDLIDSALLASYRRGYDDGQGQSAKAAFALGFGASGEGYNGKYPFYGDFETDPKWIKMRDEELAEQ